MKNIMENEKLKKIESDREIYADHYAEKIKDEELNVYVNKETGQDGKILSAYIGLEDCDGNAETGYDMAVDLD